MLFTTFEFLFFLLIVFPVFWSMRSARWQNIVVVLASYTFYAWWDWRFCFLLLFSTLFSYSLGLLMSGVHIKPHVRKTFLVLGIVVNVGILCVFKYLNFFINSFVDFLNFIGFQADSVTLKIVLPVGISFYTFQALGYIIDVYQRKAQTTHDILSFMAFISFFPQLLAGPIERANNMLPQYARLRTFDYPLAVDGCRQILWGLFKKMVIADNLSVFVDGVWENIGGQTGITLINTAIIYSVQIYCDFSGYSDIAIGLGKMFGIRIMQNFKFPYFSRSIPEFWRRWHISLMRWFRDYIYFPLGGSRCPKWQTIRNVFIVFLVSGLWHGADWTFVAWGGYHAVIIAILIVLGIKTKFPNVVAFHKLLPSMKELGQLIVTFVLASFGWILFRADNFTQFGAYVSQMLNPLSFHLNGSHGYAMVLIALVPIIWEWFFRKREHGLSFYGIAERHWIIRWSIYTLLLCIIIIFQGSSTDFIYFQF